LPPAASPESASPTPALFFGLFEFLVCQLLFGSVALALRLLAVALAPSERYPVLRGTILSFDTAFFLPVPIEIDNHPTSLAACGGHRPFA
jgi:hypothetical protein